MAGIARLLALLKALWLASWRDIQSFRSIAGQNFFLFALLVAYQQAESVEFFFVILLLVMLFPLAAGAMEKIPTERRVTWPISGGEWGIVRVGSLAFSPVAWLSALLFLRAGWRMSALAGAGGLAVQALISLIKRFARTSGNLSLYWVPAPPGIVGALMRLQCREMLATLDFYLAFALMACTQTYRTFGRPLDPAAPQIISLLVSLALSTETQVLFAIDGTGIDRYRQFPLRGWQILLAKDLAFLAFLAVLVLPLDFASGFASGVAVLAIGHHRSVLFKALPQKRWRFTSGALFPDGLIQIVALFVVGLQIKTIPGPLACVCFLTWLASLFFYGWQWDRRGRPD